jgi:endonuclease/exonuclease/phosphatase family metal-dependent hydrolase
MSGACARTPIAGAVAAMMLGLVGACSRYDHPGGDRWVPFAEIQGDLAPELRNGAPLVAPPQGTLRVVTYNVHHGPDLPAVATAFRSLPTLAAADVVLLEEADAPPTESPSLAGQLADVIGMNDAYAPAWIHSDGARHGLAVLSRFPITSAAVLDLPYFELGSASERRIALRVTLLVGEVELEVIAIHLDTRINVNDRLEQLDWAVERADASCVLGGDFNTLPFVWIGRFLPNLPQDAVAPVDVPAAVDGYMVSRGFADPTAGSGDTTNNSVANFKLDSIYVRGHGAGGSGVERGVTASDHFPVWADVVWP